MILVLTATGCSKMTPNSVSMGETKTESAYTYNADEDDDMKDLETINVYNDLDAFINENNQQAMQLAELDKDTETSSEELTQKKNAVITNYVVNLYNLAKARLQADVDSAYTHTDKYLSYLALMQTFVDAMTSESEEFDKKMAAGDRSRKNLLEIMNRPNRYISREALNSSQINFNELREYYKDKDWMCDRITTLETHLRILGTLSPFAAINFIRKGMGFEEYLREYAQYRKIKPEELLETLDRIHESAKGMKTLVKWQAYIEEYTKRLNEQARKQQDKKEGVTISTLHAVKGLEYDIVYILNVNEGSIPYRKAVLAEAVEEERRLFYVGMTRAKKKLVLAYVKRQYEKEREPSRFLEETGL